MAVTIPSWCNCSPENIYPCLLYTTRVLFRLFWSSLNSEVIAKEVFTSTQQKSNFRSFLYVYNGSLFSFWGITETVIHLDLGESTGCLSSFKYLLLFKSTSATNCWIFRKLILSEISVSIFASLALGLHFVIELQNINSAYWKGLARLTLQVFKMSDHRLPRVTDEFIHYNATHAWNVWETKSVNNY